MNNMATTIALAILGSNGLFVLIQFLITRHDTKKGKFGKIEQVLSSIEKQLKVTEKDNLRTQLLILMSDYPEDPGEIMKLAQHYFGDLHGDWYATALFNKWLEKYDIGDPAWFSNKEGGKEK